MQVTRIKMAFQQVKIILLKIIFHLPPLLAGINSDAANPGDYSKPVIPVSHPGSYNQPGVVYQFTGDIVSEKSGIFLGKDVTLDLNGFTLTYAGAVYEHIPNSGFEDGLTGWDVSGAPGAEVVNTKEVHSFIGDKILSLQKGDIIRSAYINLPLENRSYFAMCGLTGRYYTDMNGNLDNDMKISVFVEDEKGNEVVCLNEYGNSTLIGTPILNRSTRLGGGFIFAHLKDIPAGPYRVKVKAETDCLIDEIDIRPAMDVGIGIVEKTHPYCHYSHLHEGFHGAFYDYTANYKTGQPLPGIPVAEGKGTVTIKNGTIKSGTTGIVSWGIQSTADNVKIILDNVTIKTAGINSTAVDVPSATITNCKFYVNNPFIINRHGSSFYAVDLRGTMSSEVSYCEFYGGQGNLVVKGQNSMIHHNYFVNEQYVTNHYSIMAMGDGSMIFENRFEPVIGSGLEIFRHKNINIFNNVFHIEASPPSCEYHEHYSTNAIRIADYGAEWGAENGSYGNRIYNNKFYITGRKFKEYPNYIPAANALFYSTSAGENLVFGNEIILNNEDPDSDAEAFAFYIGNARGGAIFNNHIVSNSTPVWVGSAYGTASDINLGNNVFVKAENSKTDFAPVKMGRLKAENINFRSNKLDGMDFHIDKRGSEHSYTVFWTLNILAKGKATGISIIDKNGREALNSYTDETGRLSVELPEFTVEKENTTAFSPYTIVTKNGKQVVNLNKNTSITIN